MLNYHTAATAHILLKKAVIKVLELLEIIIAVFAVFGAYTLLDMLRVRLLYPKKVRRKLRAAVFFEDEKSLKESLVYAKYLRIEQKISPERLIILANDDIIECKGELAECGELLGYVKHKEKGDDAEYRE